MHFYASTDTFTWPNGAIGHRQTGNRAFDCLGPYALVAFCPVQGETFTRCVRATGYPDSFASVPARASINGRKVSGFLSLSDDGPTFVPNHKES